jgi:hypothetical protein
LAKEATIYPVAPWSGQPPDVGGTISIDLTLRFWQFSDMKRLLADIVIIVALIFFAWNKPYKLWVDQTYAKITSTLDQMGGNLQKNQDPSVKRY